MGLRGMQGTQGNFDLIVVGNGAIGCAVAFELQRRNSGLKIALVGPNSRQGSASATAAGAMLNVFAELDAGILEKPIVRHKFDLARRATDVWPEWLKDLSSAAPGGRSPVIELGTFILKNIAGDEQDDAAYRAIKSALVEFHSSCIRQSILQISRVTAQVSADELLRQSIFQEKGQSIGLE